MVLWYWWTDRQTDYSSSFRSWKLVVFIGWKMVRNLLLYCGLSVWVLCNPLKKFLKTSKLSKVSMEVPPHFSVLLTQIIFVKLCWSRAQIFLSHSHIHSTIIPASNLSWFISFWFLLWLRIVFSKIENQSKLWIL